MAKAPTPPEGLHGDGLKFWHALNKEFDLEAHHAATLAAACQCLQRAEEARAIVAKEGVTLIDRYKQVREHPSVATERNSLLAFGRLVKQLGLDLPNP